MAGYLQVTLIDYGGRETRRVYEVKGADAAATYTNAVALLADLQAVTNLGTVRPMVNIFIPAAQVAAAEGSNTDVGGKVKGISSVDGKTVNLGIPDPIAAIIRPDYTFDLEDEDLAAFLDNFEDAGIATLSDGETVTSWRFGVLDKR
jgi:hypothetical protein